MTRGERREYERAQKRAAPPRTGSPLRKFLALVLVVSLFVGAVAAAVIIAASTSSSVVHFRTVVAHDAQSAIKTVRDLINSYTK
jgi:hypothetical protein